MGGLTTVARKRTRTVADQSRAVSATPSLAAVQPCVRSRKTRRIRQTVVFQLNPQKKTPKKQPHPERGGHSYQLFVSLDASVTGQAGDQVQNQTGHLISKKTHQTQQHGSQEQVFLLGLAIGPEPEHGQEGAEGLGGGLVPHKEPN